jgi:predicted transcriptional regulator
VSSQKRDLPKATTYRLDPKLQEGLAMLGQILKRPLNRLVNEAVEAYLRTRSAEVEADLEQVLKRVRAYRTKDPDFETAIVAFAEAEAERGTEDPAEGRPQPQAGPAQSLVREVLKG